MPAAFILPAAGEESSESGAIHVQNTDGKFIWGEIAFCGLCFKNMLQQPVLA